MTNLTWHTNQSLSGNTHDRATCNQCAWTAEAWNPAGSATRDMFIRQVLGHTHQSIPVHVSRYTITMTVYDDYTVSTAECNHCPWEHTNTEPIRDIVETHWNANHNPKVTGK